MRLLVMVCVLLLWVPEESVRFVLNIKRKERKEVQANEKQLQHLSLLLDELYNQSIQSTQSLQHLYSNNSLLFNQLQHITLQSNIKLNTHNSTLYNFTNIPTHKYDYLLQNIKAFQQNNINTNQQLFQQIQQLKEEELEKERQIKEYKDSSLVKQLLEEREQKKIQNEQKEMLLKLVPDEQREKMNMLIKSSSIEDYAFNNNQFQLQPLTIYNP